MASDTHRPVDNSHRIVGQLPRRIRHIKCIQISNFTPFPVRDAVTSALSQPVEQFQLNNLSHISGEVDLSIRRRARKVSTASTSTKASSWQDEDDTSIPPDTRDRKVSHTRRSLANSSIGLSASSGTMPRISYGSPQTIRRRGRTSSVTSSISTKTKVTDEGQGISLPVSNSSFSMILPDISQQGLEQVVNSRLIETFIAITVLPPEEATPTKLTINKNRAATISHDARKTKPMRRSQNASVSSLPPSSDLKLPGKLQSRTEHTRTSSSSQFSISDSQVTSSSRTIPQDPQKALHLVPDYFSTIHRPSVNPIFQVDAQPGRDFSSSTNTTSDRLKVQLWGRIGGPSSKTAGKQRDKTSKERADGDPDWSVMEEWEFSLNDLHSTTHTTPAAKMPSNTILVSLNPPGKTFYLPWSHSVVSDPHTPSLGYSSEPEYISKKSEKEAEVNGMLVAVTESSAENGMNQRANYRMGVGNGGTSSPLKPPRTTAAYQQLFEFVHLQSLIRDHENSVTELVQKIDRYLGNDPIPTLRREISERQYRLDSLYLNSRKVAEGTAARKEELESRKRRLQERRKFLVSARILEETNISDHADLNQELALERQRLEELRARSSPIRTSVLSTLAWLYPIELYSPPDLLYTILDVPLPIPLGSNDPAPPLSLANHLSVNEDAIATALGYVAQLLQLLAAYLGTALVYPVTCVGSRSFIKDGISAMVGPRMFPLFSKGVDTYRFEYGVFLLNKDIEMLMTDRDLRALDMRHTLPNLKNLVLTVTHGEVLPLNHKLPPDSPALSMLGLDSPTHEPSNDLGSVTPRAKDNVELPEDGSTTPPASGSTTPTVATVDEKKHRAFLGLSIPEFLRGRNPSSSRTSIKGVPSDSDGGQSQGNVSGSAELGEAETPEAFGDSMVESDFKQCDGPNRRSHETEGSDGTAAEHKDEIVVHTEGSSVSVH